MGTFFSRVEPLSHNLLFLFCSISFFPFNWEAVSICLENCFDSPSPFLHVLRVKLIQDEDLEYNEHEREM